MELKVNKKDFLANLTLGGSLAGRNKSMPVLDNVKCTIRNGNIYFTSFDTENIIVHKGSYIECDAEEAKFLVNPKDLSNALKSISEENVVLKVEGNNVIVKHSRGHLSLPIETDNDFPAAPEDDVVFSTKLPVGVLGAWINNASKFVGDDNLRPALGAMCLTFHADKITCAASNAQKLFFDELEKENDVDTPQEVLVSHKVFGNILSILAASNEDEIDIEIGTACVTFKHKNAKIKSRLVLARYPNVLAVIPKSFIHEIKVSKVNLVESLNRVAIASNTTSKLIIMDCTEMFLSIDSEDVDFAKNAHDECVCEKTGGSGLRLGINGDSLLSCLSAVDGEDVTLRFIDKTRPIVIHDERSANKCLLLMPMLID